MDKGIIFSAPMVRALLDGRKTQTRRLAKVRKGLTLGELIEHGESRHKGPFVEHWATLEQLAPPRYAPGDRLYVRESCRAEELDDGLDGVRFKADGVFRRIKPTMVAAAAWPALFHYRGRGKGLIGNPVPSIHMPRWASCITLDVTEVRVQRLQDISEEDAVAEGIQQDTIPDGIIPGGHTAYGFPGYSGFPTAVSAYAALWNTLHTKPGERWEDNPWVCAVSFDVRRGNIDAGAPRHD